MLVLLWVQRWICLLLVVMQGLQFFLSSHRFPLGHHCTSFMHKPLNLLEIFVGNLYRSPGAGSVKIIILKIKTEILRKLFFQKEVFLHGEKKNFEKYFLN
jgi:hypothetical protein